MEGRRGRGEREGEGAGGGEGRYQGEGQGEGQVEVRVRTLERVPSGNAMRLFPACSEATASRNVSICDLRSLRRSGICRANCIAQPMSGILRISIFEMYLTCRRPGVVAVAPLWK